MIRLAPCAAIMLNYCWSLEQQWPKYQVLGEKLFYDFIAIQLGRQPCAHLSAQRAQQTLGCALVATSSCHFVSNLQIQPQTFISENGIKSSTEKHKLSGDICTAPDHFNSVVHVFSKRTQSRHVPAQRGRILLSAV